MTLGSLSTFGHVRRASPATSLATSQRRAAAGGGGGGTEPQKFIFLVAFSGRSSSLTFSARHRRGRVKGRGWTIIITLRLDTKRRAY
jgi:hypothetical protein